MTAISWLDIVLGLMLVSAAVSGWRRGLVSSIFSLVGLILGAYAGTRVAVWLVPTLGLSSSTRPVLSIACVLLGSAVGSTLIGFLGRRLRKKLLWKPLKAVDSAGGVVMDVAWLCLILWILGSALAVIPGSVSREVRASRVLQTVDVAIGRVSDGAAGAITRNVTDEIVGRLVDLLDNAGAPRAFFALGGFSPANLPPVDSTVARDPQVRAAALSVVRVSGNAVGCDAGVTGTGFVFARNRVMTNAHVVAGMRQVLVSVSGGRTRTGHVVYFDSRTDVAIVKVDGLRLTPLAFAKNPHRGESTVALGFPGGGPLKYIPARVNDLVNARGSDIYGTASVQRQIVVLQAKIRRGDSGGPLVDEGGRVRALVFATSVQDPDIGYAISVDQLAAARGSKNTDPVNTGRCTTHD